MKDMLLDLEPEVVRFIIDDSQAELMLNDQKMSNMLVEHFLSLKATGIETVICIRFPKGNRGEASYKQDRIPSDEEMVESILMITEFLTRYDTIIDYYQLQNEIMGGPGVYSDSLNGELVINAEGGLGWMNALAAATRQHIDSQNLNIKLVTPAITGAIHAYREKSQLRGYVDREGLFISGNHVLYFIEQIVQLGADYCDAIDLHLNVAGMEELQFSIAVVDSVREALDVDVPLVTTEWNQAKELADEINQKGHRFHEMMVNAVDRPVMPDVWKNYMELFDYDETFMSESFRYMEEQGFTFACYNGVSDSKDNLIFLPVALFPTHTVQEPWNVEPNEPFHSLFKAIR